LEESGKKDIPRDILVFLSFGVFEVVIRCVTCYQPTPLFTHVVLEWSGRMGHTFPSAVSVGVALSELGSIYETGLGEV
jgi:hypothetical protein